MEAERTLSLLPRIINYPSTPIIYTRKLDIYPQKNWNQLKNFSILLIMDDKQSTTKPSLLVIIFIIEEEEIG